MTLYYVIGLLILVPVAIGLMMKRQGKFGKGPLVIAVFMAVVSIGIYATTMYDSEHVAWLDQQEALLPDVQTLLATDEAPESLKQLDGAHFLGLLSYYAKEYPEDSRVWQKLAVVMVNLQMPEEALKAIRRYLALDSSNLQAHQLEIQLLSELVNSKNISSRQLWFALDKLKDMNELQAQDYFFLAGLSRQHEFYDLAIEYWEKVIATDSRPDEALAPKALQGRKLLQRMIDDAKNRLEQKETHVFAAEESNDAEVSPAEPEDQEMIVINLQIKPETAEAINEYLENSANATYQMWVSIRQDQPGPPLAAKLIWLNAEDLTALQSGYEAMLTMDDLIMPGTTWPTGENVTVSLSMVLSQEKSDPITAKQSPYRQTLTQVLSNEVVYLSF